MTDDHYRHADDGGSVLNAALGAVMLVAAGLSLMVWQDYQDARDAQDATVTVSALLPQ